MKLLFDANLSPKLAVRIADLFPGSTHIFSVGIPEGTGDAAIWEFAGDNEFVLVTGDSDFNKLEARLGHPPYVVLLQRLDYPTRVAAELLRQNAIRIRELENGNQGVLSLRIAETLSLFAIRSRIRSRPVGQLWRARELAVPLETVKENFRRYGLLDEGALSAWVVP